MTFQKLRIGVFMGGRSIEREVSFNSGRTICDHLDTYKYTIIPIFQTEEGALFILPQHFLHRGKISDFFCRLEQEAKKITWDGLKKLVDFVYLAVHGRYGEDGTIQGMLELLSIPYLGTKVLGSALGMSKAAQKKLLGNSNVDVPRGFSLSPQEVTSCSEATLQKLLEQNNLLFPVIIKPSHEGSSLGIAVAQNLQELKQHVNTACFIDSRRVQEVIVEEKLNGMEFVCVLLQKYISPEHSEWFSLPLTEVVIEENATIFDYEQKYMPGRALKITPARCSKDAQEKIVDACTRATELLEFSTIARIDGFLTTDGRVVLIDPNSLTGMSPSTFLFHQAAEVNMSHTDLINFLIENELKQYGLTAQPTINPLSEAKGAMQEHKKIRVAVLLGGDSNEREVSLESGRNVCYKLSPQKYEVIPIFVDGHMELFKLNQKLLIKNTTKAIAQLATEDIHVNWSDLADLCDFVFIALHGGKGENGSVQGALEMLDLPYNGPGVLASALCMDKARTNKFLGAGGFDVPQHLLISREMWTDVHTQEEKIEQLAKQLAKTVITFPLISKPHDDGCSVFVEKVTSVEQLVIILDHYFSTTTKKALMIEELVTGMELTVGVTGNNEIMALPPTWAVAQKGILSIQEKFLPGAGENQTPAPLPVAAIEFVQETVASAFKFLGGHGYSRLDCFYQDAKQSPTGEQRVVFIEVNTLPALTPATCLFHQAAEIGIKPMELIDKIIELGLEKYHQQHLTFQPSQKTLDTHEESTKEIIPQVQAQPAETQEKRALDANAMPTDFMMKLF